MKKEERLKMMTDGGWLETENKEHVKKKNLKEIEKNTWASTRGGARAQNLCDCF